MKNIEEPDPKIQAKLAEIKAQMIEQIEARLILPTIPSHQMPPMMSVPKYEPEYRPQLRTLWGGK